VIPIECDHVRVVSKHEKTVARDGYATIETDCRIAAETGCPRLPVVPDLASRTCIQGPDFIRARNVHHAANDNRSVLHLADIGHWKYPFGSEPGDVGF